MSKITKWMVGSLTAMVVTAGSLASLAGPAQAYGWGDCPGNTSEVDVIRVDAGPVDFGDIFHLGGAPQGGAIVCWAADGRVAIKGRLFADSSTPIQANADITYYANGVQASFTTVNFTGHGAQSTVVGDITPRGTGTYDRVRIRMYSGSTQGSWPGTLRHTSNRYRG